MDPSYPSNSPQPPFSPEGSAAATPTVSSTSSAPSSPGGYGSSYPQSPQTSTQSSSFFQPQMNPLPVQPIGTPPAAQPAVGVPPQNIYVVPVGKNKLSPYLIMGLILLVLASAGLFAFVYIYMK